MRDDLQGPGREVSAPARAGHLGARLSVSIESLLSVGEDFFCLRVPFDVVAKVGTSRDACSAERLIEGLFKTQILPGLSHLRDLWNKQHVCD